MRIDFSEKDISQASSSFVKITLVQDGINRLVVRDGVSTLEIGTKKWSDVNRRKFILLCRSIVQSAKQNKIKKIAVQLNKSPFPQLSDIPLPELGSLIAQAFEMANYEFTKCKTPPKGGWQNIEEVLICGDTPPAMKKGFKKAQIIGQEVNAARELSNTPGGDMTPALLAKAAHAALKDTHARVKILGRKEMTKLGMGAVLGVAKGSEEESKFIVVEYWGAHRSQKPVVLIGKGVTFDTGGLQVKPGDSMYEMHMDMSGGAAVIHAVALAAKLKIKTNVVGLIPAVENSPSGSAVRPGDILTSLSGKTIEILHTDAEGRVILADALTYAKRYHPRCVVDAATLTGAALTALGTQASGLMANDQNFENELRELGEISGDYVWPFPLWEEYDDMTKGNFGDVPNISTAGNSRYGGVIAGGKFLEVFAKELAVPWAHLDIAPRMTSSPNEFLAKGAAGAPVRLLFALIDKYAN